MDVEMPMVVGSLTFVGIVIFRLGWVEHGRGYSVFIMLINVKMSTVVGILTFGSMMSFMPDWGDHNWESYCLDTTKWWQANFDCLFVVAFCDRKF